MTLRHAALHFAVAASLTTLLVSCTGRGVKPVEQAKPGEGGAQGATGGAGAGDSGAGTGGAGGSGGGGAGSFNTSDSAADGDDVNAGGSGSDDTASNNPPVASGGVGGASSAAAVGGASSGVGGASSGNTGGGSTTGSNTASGSSGGTTPTVMAPTVGSAATTMTPTAGAQFVGSWTGLQDGVPASSALTVQTVSAQGSTPVAGGTAPAPGPSAAPSGSKKGLGMWGTAGKEGSKVGATWYYNWAPKPNMGDSGSLEFVPMIWGSKHANADGYANAKSAASPYLLGPNEPDKSGEEASGMSPESVIAIWPELMNTGKKLGSPAVAGDYNWLKRFMDMAQQKNYRVDFIAVHSYPDAGAGDSVDKLRTLLTGLNKQYNRPIWLTEFGFCTWATSNSVSEATRKAFMVKVLAMLDGLSFVERYAWFSDKSYRSCENSAIYDGSGNLSATGRAYGGQ